MNECRIGTLILYENTIHYYHSEFHTRTMERKEKKRKEYLQLLNLGGKIRKITFSEELT